MDGSQPTRAVEAVVCLPTRNEVQSVARMIEDVRKAGYDVFIVDQQSTDGTLEACAELGARSYQRAGNGKGWGVQRALEVAAELGAEVLVLIDCDCTYLPEDIERVVAGLGERASCIGYRQLSELPLPHRLVNVVHTTAVNWLFGARLSDINSGLRALHVDSYHGRVTAAGFDVEAELTVRAIRSERGVAEVPIGYRKRVGESKVRAWDAARILWRILSERLRLPPLPSNEARLD